MERHWLSTLQRLSESLNLVLISTRDEIRLNTLDETFTTVFIPASQPQKHNYLYIALINREIQIPEDSSSVCENKKNDRFS